MFTTKSLLVLFLLSKDFKRTFNWDPDDLNTPTADDVNTNPILSASPETSYIAAGSSQAIQNVPEQPNRDIVHLTHPRASVASQPISIPIPPPVQRSDSYDAVTASLEDGSYGMFSDLSSPSYDWLTAPLSSQQTASTHLSNSDTTLSSQFPAQSILPEISEGHQQPQQSQTVSASSQPTNQVESVQNLPLSVAEFLDSPPSSPNTRPETAIDNSLSREYIPPVVGAGPSGDSSGARQNQISGDSDDTDDNASQTDFQSDKSSTEEGFDRSGPSNMDPPRKIRIRIIRPESGTGISKGSRQTGSDASTEIQYEIEPQDYNWNNESSESQQIPFAEEAQMDTAETSKLGDRDDEMKKIMIHYNSLSSTGKYRYRMKILAQEADRLKLKPGDAVGSMPSKYRDLLLYARKKVSEEFKNPVNGRAKRFHEQIGGGSLDDQESSGYASQIQNRDMLILMAAEAERLGLNDGGTGDGISPAYHALLKYAYDRNRKRLNSVIASKIRKREQNSDIGSQNAQVAN